MLHGAREKSPSGMKSPGMGAGVESENTFISFQTKEGRKASRKASQLTKLSQEIHGKVRNRRQHPQDASVSLYVTPWFEKSLLHVKNGTYPKTSRWQQGF